METDVALQIAILIMQAVTTIMLALRFKFKACGMQCSVRPKDSPPSDPPSPASIASVKSPSHDDLDIAEKGVHPPVAT